MLEEADSVDPVRVALERGLNVDLAFVAARRPYKPFTTLSGYGPIGAV